MRAVTKGRDSETTKTMLLLWAWRGASLPTREKHNEEWLIIEKEAKEGTLPECTDLHSALVEEVAPAPPEPAVGPIGKRSSGPSDPELSRSTKRKK